MIFIEEPDYFFNTQQENFAELIMKMSIGSIAEVSGITDGAYLQKFIPTSYALARKTGMIDLEVICAGGTSIADEIKELMNPIADKRGITQLMIESGGMKTVHLYFYPKENE